MIALQAKKFLRLFAGHGVIQGMSRALEPTDYGFRQIHRVFDD